MLLGQMSSRLLVSFVFIKYGDPNTKNFKMNFASPIVDKAASSWLKVLIWLVGKFWLCCSLTEMKNMNRETYNKLMNSGTYNQQMNSGQRYEYQRNWLMNRIRGEQMSWKTDQLWSKDKTLCSMNLFWKKYLLDLY